MTITRQFKTNINCKSCLSRVTPHLNQEPSISSWSVETNVPEKILTVEGEKVSAEDVKNAVERAGYRVFGEIPVNEPV